MEDKRVEACYKQVFDRIDELLGKDKTIIIAIDGKCGSGKSYLAELLAKIYDCNVFHMDDYFLPLEMKTNERLAEPGGNVHYERFKEEVLEPLCENRTVIYRPYLCGAWRFDEPRSVEPKRLNIIEGSYSMHPFLRGAYDLTIYLELEEEEQIKRIAQRNGENLQQFLSLWIPLENKYFSELNIKGLSDIALDTTRLFN
ncbi:MAG: uridine kinase [Anaerolineaceae bacterium]|nr:MAG: uridine kinase [Anaerolineaceae bacterium]